MKTLLVLVRVMKRMFIAFLGIALAAMLSVGQDSTSAPAHSATGAASNHGAIPVKVEKTLNSSKLRQDDTVELETAGSFKLADGTLVPKESKLLGHVVTATARSKGDPESKLTLAFNAVILPGGKSFSLKGSVQAVFPPADEIDPGVASASTTPGGAAQVMEPSYRPTDIKSGSDVKNSQAQPEVNPKSVGVQGIDGLQLENGALTTKGKSVKLGSGVRMIVHIDIFE
jgi:hypothetical protein